MKNRLSFANVGHDRFTIHQGDCLEVMRGMADASVDSIVTDPPYELGFMGRSWDASGVAFNVDVWREALRVLKPGGHLLAFSGSRTYHRMACAIEDAGFEIRDQIMWLYGSGFPKSLDVSKAIDKAAGAAREVVGQNAYASRRPRAEYQRAQKWGATLGGSESTTVTAPATEAARQWQGWGTALKPAHEPIVVARKPLVGTVAANVLAHGTGALNIDGCRVPTTDTWSRKAGYTPANEGYGNGAFVNKTEGAMHDGGRWPANVIHDGLTEKWARYFYCAKASKRDRDEGLEHLDAVTAAEITGRKEGSAGLVMDGGKANPYAGTTGAARRNSHPTVKPTDLMRYLCRLVTPPGGLVLDPFMGSGSTGKAAMLEGFRFVGIELSEEYIEIARARIASAAQ